MMMALMELRRDDGLNASHPITIDLHLNDCALEGRHEDCTLDVSFYLMMMFYWQAKRRKRLKFALRLGAFTIHGFRFFLFLCSSERYHAMGM
jgi:hypothetical protein